MRDSPNCFNKYLIWNKIGRLVQVFVALKVSIFFRVFIYLIDNVIKTNKRLICCPSWTWSFSGRIRALCLPRCIRQSDHIVQAWRKWKPKRDRKRIRPQEQFRPAIWDKKYIVKPRRIENYMVLLTFWVWNLMAYLRYVGHSYKIRTASKWSSCTTSVTRILHQI
jgi:hypothetical protein